jgi:hypothetical protein
MAAKLNGSSWGVAFRLENDLPLLLLQLVFLAAAWKYNQQTAESDAQEFHELTPFEMNQSSCSDVWSGYGYYPTRLLTSSHVSNRRYTRHARQAWGSGCIHGLFLTIIYCFLIAHPDSFK